MGLDVRVLGPEELLGPVDRELLDLVDHLAAAVVAAARIALGVLVGGNRPDGLENGRPGEVLRGDELQLAPLPLQLLRQQTGDLRVDVIQADRGQVLEGQLSRRHARGWYSRGLLPLAVALAALVVAPAALAGPNLFVGAAEDGAVWGDPSTQMSL